jgi:hypothetical protein
MSRSSGSGFAPPRRARPAESSKSVFKNFFKELTIPFAGLAIALTIAVAGFLASFQDRTHKTETEVRSLAQYEAVKRQLDDQLYRLGDAQATLHRSQEIQEELQRAIDKARKDKVVLSYREGLDPADRQALERIAQTQQDLDKRLSSLEGALMASPERAVSVPILKQQVTDLEERDKGEHDAIHGEIGRQSTLMIWFFGSMVTLILGVGGLFFNVFKHQTDKARGQQA